MENRIRALARRIRMSDFERGLVDEQLRQDERVEELETQEFATVDLPNAALNFVFYEGGGVISAGGIVDIRVFFDGTIVRWGVIANESGTIRFNVEKTTYAGFAGSLSAIDGTDPPELSTAQKDESTSLTGWSTTVTDGDIIRVEIDSAVTPLLATRVTVTLEVEIS